MSPTANRWGREAAAGRRPADHQLAVRVRVDPRPVSGHQHMRYGLRATIRKPPSILRPCIPNCAAARAKEAWGYRMNPRDRRTSQNPMSNKVFRIAAGVKSTMWPGLAASRQRWPVSFAGRPAAFGVVTKSHSPEHNRPYKLAITPRGSRRCSMTSRHTTPSNRPVAGRPERSR
jgi:hypothetical protein